MIGNAGVSNGGSTDVVNGIIERFKAQTETIDANTFVEFVNNGNTDLRTNTNIQTNYYIMNGRYKTKAMLLDNNKIFLTYLVASSGLNGNIYGVIITINDKTISFGNSKNIVDTGSSYATISIDKLNDSSVIICYGFSTTYGIICNVSGTTITTGTRTKIADSTYSSYRFRRVFSCLCNKQYYGNNRI